MNSFFSNTKIVELAGVLAGPAAGMFFAELGAEVIKIENPGGEGDITRTWRLNNEDPANVSAYFSSVNYKKNIIFSDLKKEEERNKVYELIKDADIVITNYKKGDAGKLGMDHPTLSAINPRLIYAHISGFGEEDGRTAFDVILQAETGYLSMTGSPGHPAKLPVAFIDIVAAHQLKEAILVAMLQREKTGKGAFVTVSLYDAAIASLANQACNWLMAGHVAAPMGTLHPNIAPYGELLQTADGQQIVLAVGTDRQFRQLCEVLDTPLYKEETYATNTARIAHRSLLAVLLNEKAGQRDATSLMEALLAVNVPAGLVRNLQQVFENEKARQLLLEEEIDGTRTLRPRTAVFTLSENQVLPEGNTTKR